MQAPLTRTNLDSLSLNVYLLKHVEAHQALTRKLCYNTKEENATGFLVHPRAHLTL